MKTTFPELTAQPNSDADGGEDREDRAFLLCPDCGAPSCDCDLELQWSFDLHMARGEFVGW